MRRSLFVMAIVTMVCGCMNLTPEQQCQILRNSTKIGLHFAFDKLNDNGIFSKDRQAKVASVFEKQILPKLRNQAVAPVTKADLDGLLTVLNVELSDFEKTVVQTGLDTALTFAPLPEQGVVGSSVVDVLICLFEGVLDSFAENTFEIKAVAKPVKLEWHQQQ